MPKMIFVNLPVADVEKSAAFYEAMASARTRASQAWRGRSNGVVGYDRAHDPELHAHFGEFRSKRNRRCEERGRGALRLSIDSRDGVDAIVEKAVAAGGKADPGPKQDHGFMYGRSFEDLDGHVFEPMWMDLEAAMAAMGQCTEAA